MTEITQWKPIVWRRYSAGPDSSDAYIVRALVAPGMARSGWPCGDPISPLSCTPIGGVGQIQPVQANLSASRIRSPQCSRAQAAVGQRHGGQSAERGAQTYTAVHVEGAPLRWPERQSSRSASSSYVHISGIGANPNSSSPYIASKGLGEKATRDSIPRRGRHASISRVRPRGWISSIASARLRAIMPVLPLMGGRRNSFAAGLCRGCRPSGRRRALRSGEAGRDHMNSAVRRTMTLARSSQAYSTAQLIAVVCLSAYPSAPSRWIAVVYCSSRSESDIRAFFRNC